MQQINSATRLAFTSFVIMAAGLWQAGCTAETTTATTDQQAISAATESCAASLPSLQQAAYSSGSGHIEALQSLITCYDQLGETDRATAARWRLYQDRTDY